MGLALARFRTGKVSRLFNSELGGGETSPVLQGSAQPVLRSVNVGFYFYFFPRPFRLYSRYTAAVEGWLQRMLVFFTSPEWQHSGMSDGGWRGGKFTPSCQWRWSCLKPPRLDKHHQKSISPGFPHPLLVLPFPSRDASSLPPPPPPPAIL